LNLLATRSLSVRRGGRDILSDVDFELCPGSIVAVVGRSGAGKTTLLRTLAGLIEPDGGVVRRAAEALPAISFQEPRLIGRFSVLSNVVLGGLSEYPAWRGLWQTPPELRGRALRLLDEVGLLDRANDRADRLSGGQKQRAAIARTLMVCRGPLLCDEPTAHLDPATADGVAGVLRSLVGPRVPAMVVATHRRSLALDLANRVAFLREGRITEIRPREGLDAAKLDDFFAGTAPC